MGKKEHRKRRLRKGKETRKGLRKEIEAKKDNKDGLSKGEKENTVANREERRTLEMKIEKSKERRRKGD